jgi:hypothetical protein
MKALQSIASDVGLLPTIMSINQELTVMEDLMCLSDRDLSADLRTLDLILERLYESHTGGAIFEVNESNRPAIQVFARRLRALQLQNGEREYTGMLCSLADALDAAFPD